MQKTNWSLILPLIFLFAAGLAGFVMPAWLIGLSKAAKEYGPTELNEWLGFFGNIIAGTIAVAAAYLAWLAAQGQIGAARQQGAVVAHEALQRLLPPLRREEELVNRVFHLLGEIELAGERARAYGTTFAVREWSDIRSRFDKLGLELESLLDSPLETSQSMNRRRKLGIYLLQMRAIAAMEGKEDAAERAHTIALKLSDLIKDVVGERARIQFLIDNNYKVLVGG